MLWQNTYKNQIIMFKMINIHKKHFKILSFIFIDMEIIFFLKITIYF